MAPRIITVRIAIADPGRAEELAAALSEERELTVAETAEPSDVVVTDGGRLDGMTPHVMWGGESAGDINFRAIMPAAAEVGTVVAAIRLAAAGYRIERDVRAGLG